ncbi:MAG: tRNA 2-thiouridine(34) synthase MnmA [candidate division SR1 bacterium]|nr:tRNA 2-thiouridine(34) synthase MnmA [candidate division SR1 bacterium]
MKRVLVGMSGGVDSAIAAYLLQQEGYEVVAGFMKNYVSDSGNCTTYTDAEEAIKVSKFLGIKIISFDLQKEYNEKIIEYIYKGYQQGITPNPDVLCNSLIKFDVFLQKAMELGFDYIATGHYARIVKTQKRKNDKTIKKSLSRLNASSFKLLRGVDHNKDQSYFLSGLNQFQLSKSLFPVGMYTKPEIRTLAKKIGLPNATRKDSQGLCFIGNIPIKEFLLKKLPKKEGNIINTLGKVVGKHEGAYFFTIGQRQGLCLPFKAYVIKTDVKKNTVVVGEREDKNLFEKTICTTGRHRIEEKHKLPTKILAKIRYRQEPQEATLKQDKNKNIIVVFKEKQRAIAPGQTIVAYKKDECIGSGIII